MPRNDQMGPQGLGPMTGRGMGRCNNQAQLMHGGKGQGNAMRGCNNSRKMQRGMNRQSFAQFNDVDDRDLLIQRQQQLQAQLKAIDLQLENL